MFGKDSRKLDTIVGEGTEIRGEMSVRGTLRVDGSIDGNVRADWVIVGESGRIKGNVNAGGMTVGGAVEGNIDSAGLVDLKPKARVLGEIQSGKLAVSEGAAFDGQSRMRSRAEGDEGRDTRVIALKPPPAHS